MKNLSFLLFFGLSASSAAFSAESQLVADHFVSVNFDQRAYHSSDVVDFFVTIVNRPTNSNLSVQLQASFGQDPSSGHPVQLAALTGNTFSFSSQPLAPGQYTFTVSVYLKDAQGNVSKVEDKVTRLPVDVAQAGGALDPLRATLLNSMDHHILIQNNDGGWNFYTNNPDSLRSPCDNSRITQFGVNALGLLQGYQVDHEFGVVPAVFKTAQILQKASVHRKDRLYPEDSEFLMVASHVMGFKSYATQAQASLQAEIEYSAAMFILRQTDPESEEVNKIPQAQIAAVSLPDAAGALYKRLQAFRSPNLVGYDLGSRIRAALKVGNNAWALELARLLKLNFTNTFDQTKTFALMHLANLISGLKPFSGPEFDATIDVARLKLLSMQLANGSFSSGQAASISDHAYILSALSDLGTESQALGKLVAFLESTQLPGGSWNDQGFESVEGQSQLMASMALVVSRQQVFPVGAALSGVADRLGPFTAPFDHPGCDSVSDEPVPLPPFTIVEPFL